VRIWIGQEMGRTIEEEKVNNKIRRLLEYLGLDNAEIGIRFTTDEEIRELNKRYRQKDAPTNVLSFCMQEGESFGLHPDLLGDIVISLDTATREAQECGFDLAEMIDFYLIHGLLHLLGYHHDHPKHEKMMRKLWEVLKHKPYWED